MLDRVDSIAKLIERFSSFTKKANNDLVKQKVNVAKENAEDSPNLFDGMLVDDTKNVIFSNLNFLDLKQSSMVSRDWHKLTSADGLWQSQSLELGPDLNQSYDNKSHKQQFLQKSDVLNKKSLLLRNFIHNGPPTYRTWNVSMGLGGMYQMNNKDNFANFNPQSYMRINIFNSPIVYPHIIINFAVASGLLVNYHEVLFGNTLLHLLIDLFNVELVNDFLLQHGDKVDINSTNNSSMTPLALAFTHIAADEHPKPDYALTLLKSGAALTDNEIALFESINPQKIKLDDKWKKLFSTMIENGLDKKVITRKFPQYEKQNEFLYQVDEAEDDTIRYQISR